MTVQNGDILKAVMEVTLADGSIAQNVYYWRASFAAGQADLTVTNEIESKIEGAYSQLSSYLLNSMTQNPCTVDQIEWSVTLGRWEVTRHVGDFTPTIGFNNITDGLPNQSSAFATFNTTRPKSRGRKFIFPFGEDSQAGTYLIGAALSAMSAYAGAILASIVIGPLNELIPGIPRVLVEAFLDYEVAIVTNVLGSQRRRRPGVGA